MPTLWKHPESQYWFAKITLPDGRRTSRTTKQTDRNAAIKAAFAMEKTAKLARSNELTQSAVVKLARDLCEAVGAASIEMKTIRQHFEDELANRKTMKCSPATLARYTPIVSAFLAHLGTGRASASLASLSATEIESFRNAELAKGKGGTTADFAVKLLRGFLRPAVNKGIILHNPAMAVSLTGEVAQERQPFTDSELAALLDSTRGTDWEGMILFGVHCGIRLADTAHLTWGAFRAEERKLVFFESKNRKTIEIALHTEVVRWLESRPRGVGKAPIFPTLAMHETGSAGGLSNAFSAIMEKAKIAVPMGETRTGKGRTFRGKGFHSMRHTMISRMANADVSADVRRAIAGHASDAAHRRYTHLKLETQRRAVDSMPAVRAGNR